MKTRNNKQTKTSRVKAYLKLKGSITYLEAEKIGVPRLSAIIFNLKDKGWEFRNIRVDGTNSLGDTTKCDRYILVNLPETEK